MSSNVFIYRIDSADTILSVGDNWCTFANANDWSGALQPKDVVGHKLWEFIQDPETRHLYKELFKRVRRGMTSRTIPFRCDSPSERRYLEILIEVLPDQQLSITSTILRTEHRHPVSLLKTGKSKSKDLVTVCSMCKKIKVAPGQWSEIEDGLNQLKLFEADKIPQLTHGLCNSCFKAAMAEIDDAETSNIA